MGVYYHTVIPHTSRPEILLLSGPDGWALPSQVHPPSVSGWHAADVISQATEEQFGLQVTVLRCLGLERREGSEDLHWLYALENHSPSWAPCEAARWFDRTALAGLSLAHPEHRAWLEAWFDWSAAAPISALRVSWYIPGWYTQAVAWVRATLERLGRPVAGRIEQVRSGQRSYLMRIPTTSGAIYFKAVPQQLAHEVPLTQDLARQYPLDVPAVLATEEERRWMLLEDVGRTTLEDIDDIACYERALARYGRIQVEQAAHIGSLLALGCPDRRPTRLAAELDSLLADEDAMRPGPYGLNDAEIGRLRRLAPQIREKCRALAEYRVPCSIEHGDLWVGNMVVRGEGCVLVDWSDASVSHPFFSLTFFYEGDDYFFQSVPAGRRLAAIPDLRERMCRAYLQPWTVFEPLGRLLEALALAQSLAGLHYALLYHRIILPAMEIRWEMQNMLPYHLRKVIAHL